MKCEICHLSIEEGVTLHRQNELGVDGVWRCSTHNQKPIDPEIKDIVEIIEDDNRRRDAKRPD